MSRKLWALLLVGFALILAGASISLSGRYRVEEANKATGIVLEWSVIEDFAAGQGISVTRALNHLKQQGLSHVSVSEDTGAELFARGLLRVDEERHMVTGSWTAFARLVPALEVKSGTRPKVTKYFDHDWTMPLGSETVGTLRSLPLGLDPHACQSLREAKLGIVARLVQPAGLTPARLRRTLGAAKRLGASVYLPLGEQVLGFRDLMDVTAEELATQGLLYATPEFSKISGDDKLSQLAKENLVRLHPIQAAELDKLSPAEFLERFVKASRERGMRLLLIRPLTNSAEKPAFALGESVRTLVRALDKEGIVIGMPRPYTAPQVPGWTRYAIQIGILCCLAWVGLAHLSQSRWGWLSLAGMGLITVMSASYAALVGALLFPVLGYLLFASPSRLPAVVRYLLLSGVSLMGGLCVSGLLNSLETLVRIDTFAGVKLAHFFPMIVIALLLISRQVNLREVISSPLRVGQLLLGIFGLVAVGFMLMRTGNDNPGVSGWELKLRSLLEHFFVVRPRTKELFLGHPALLLGMLLQPKNGKSSELGSWSTLLLAIGSIGQTSIVNTLCHLHTPLAVGFLRIAVGLVLGAIVGLGFYVGLWVLGTLGKKGQAVDG